jgi:hypothetical protein
MSAEFPADSARILFSMAPNRLNKKVDGCRQCHWESDAIRSHRIGVE